MGQGRSRRHPVAQDWLRSSIRYVGADNFHSDASDACLITRKGLPRGTYTLRLTVKSDDPDNEATVSIEPVGGGNASASGFRINTTSPEGCLTLPLQLTQRSRIRIHPTSSPGAFQATWSVLPSDPAASLALLRQWTSWTAPPPADGDSDSARDTVEMNQRFEQLLSGKRLRTQRKTRRASTQSNRNSDPEYSHYLELIEPGLKHSSEQIRAWLAMNPDAPTISILIPTYNTNPDHLRACLDSIRAQSYSHWELCICDDCSSQDQVREILTDYAEQDERIKLTFRRENGHICRSSNDALALATGEFIALVDHDDVLADDALYWVARELQLRPCSNLVYSDEDKIDESGRRSSPHFKPSFNLDLLLAYNFISHLGVYRTETVRFLGGFRIGLEGSQDHDLALRVVQHSGINQIVHIPRVLYHWRMHEASTAINPGSKDYTTQRGLRAVQEFLNQDTNHGAGPAVATSVAPNRFRCQWPIPEQQPSVELVIPTRDKAEILKLAVESILKITDYDNYSITIVDNQSIEPATHELFRDLKQKHPNKIQVRAYNKPFNYSAINNHAVQKSRADIIGLVNNDVEAIQSDWLKEMVSHCIRPDVGCVGAKLLYSNDTIQHGGVIIGIGQVAGHAHKYFPRSSTGYVDRLMHTQQMSAVTAACLLVERRIYNEVGGLNEKDLRIAFNDVDFCLRVHSRGYRNLFTPYACLYHHESISRGAEDTAEKQQRFLREITFMLNQYDVLGKGKLPNDLFYNPNLTGTHENFTINKDLQSVKDGLQEQQRKTNRAHYYLRSNSIYI